MAKPDDVLRFLVRVKPGSKSTSVGGTWGTDEALNVSVKERAIDGSANDGVVDLLATVLKVRKRQLSIVQGQTHRTKLIEVADPTPVTHERLSYWKAKD